MISFKRTYEGKELQDDLKNRPCIEIPADWSNENAESARKMKGALCLELWGNRRMIRADPSSAADLREHITGRREDPTEPAWSAGPWPKWMSSKQAEDFLRNIPWTIEVVLGSYRTSKDGVDIMMVKVTSKDPPPAQLPKIDEK